MKVYKGSEGTGLLRRREIGADSVLPAAAAPREIPGCGAAQRAEEMAGGAPGAKAAILRWSLMAAEV
jgi:hypothetical protein